MANVPFLQTFTSAWNDRDSEALMDHMDIDVVFA